MVIIQNIINDKSVDKPDLRSMLQGLLQNFDKSACELLVRLVAKDEIQSLNKTYRQQDKPTNVLAFPSELSIQIKPEPLGDVVICPAVVAEEANQQTKPFAHHLSHIAIHGTLHLLGFNHIKPDEAAIMEALEVKLLQQMDIPNPYSTL